MYIVRSEFLVIPPLRTEFEAWNAQLSALASTRPGFQRATLLESLAYPGKYTRIMVWENREAVPAFWASEEFRTFAQTNPVAAIATPGTPMRAYEDLELVREAGEYQYLHTADITIPPAQAQAYEQSRQELLQLVRREGRRIALTALLRSAGVAGQYAIGIGSLSAEDFNASLAMPAVAAYRAAHPLSEFGGTETMEGSAVMQVTVAAPVTA